MGSYVAILIAHIRTSVRSVSANFAGESGQDLIEYALLSGIIAAALVVIGAGVLTGALTNMVTGIGHCIDFDKTTPCSV